MTEVQFWLAIIVLVVAGIIAIVVVLTNTVSHTMTDDAAWHRNENRMDGERPSGKYPWGGLVMAKNSFTKRSTAEDTRSHKKGGRRGGRPTKPYNERICQGCLEIIEPNLDEPSWRHNARVIHPDRPECLSKKRKRDAGILVDEEQRPPLATPHWGWL